MCMYLQRRAFNLITLFFWNGSVNKTYFIQDNVSIVAGVLTIIIIK